MQFANLTLTKPINETHAQNNQSTSQQQFYYYFYKGQVVCSFDRDGKTSLLTSDKLAQTFVKNNVVKHVVYLGTQNDTANNSSCDYFAVNLSELDTFYETHNLKELAEKALDEDMEIAILGYAAHLLFWLEMTSFCSRDGSKLTAKLDNGILYKHVLYCPKCKLEYYPRINPAVITQITYDDKIFLARQPRWPDKRYSVIAGFVEPGETLEATVKRETCEETNIVVEDIEYFGSQPWPFPNALMLGFKAKATSIDFQLDENELSHGFWITAEELMDKVKQKEILLPTSYSISCALVNDFVFAQTSKSITEHLSQQE